MQRIQDLSELKERLLQRIGQQLPPPSSRSDFSLTPASGCDIVPLEGFALIVPNHSYSWGFNCARSSFRICHCTVVLQWRKPYFIPPQIQLRLPGMKPFPTFVPSKSTGSILLDNHPLYVRMYNSNSEETGERGEVRWRSIDALAAWPRSQPIHALTAVTIRVPWGILNTHSGRAASWAENMW